LTNRPYSQTIQQNFRDVMQTPAAPEVFDDQTPLLPTIDVSLQKDNQSTLLVKPYLPTPSSAQTPITKGFQVSLGAAGLATVYTPTSGKILWITTIVISCTTLVDVKIGDNVTNAFAASTLYDGLALRFGVATNSICITLPNPMKVVTLLNVYASGAAGMNVGFQGFEVAV
jgi:hypothetical protein